MSGKAKDSKVQNISNETSLNEAEQNNSNGQNSDILPKSNNGQNDNNNIQSTDMSLNDDKYKIIYNGEQITIDMPMVNSDYELAQSISGFLSCFVRIKGKDKYDQSMSQYNSKLIYVEDSLPFVQHEKLFYAFSNFDELTNFYKSKKLFVKSIEFFSNRIDCNKFESKKFLDFAKKYFLFDLFLEIQTLKIIKKEFKVNGKPIFYNVTENDSDDAILKSIKKDHYKNKSFIALSFCNGSEVKANAIVKGENDIQNEIELPNSEITIENFIKMLAEEYNYEKVKIKNATKSMNKKESLLSLVLEKDDEFLKLNLKFHKLKLNIHEERTNIIVSEINTIKQVLRKIYLDKNNEVENKDKLIANKFFYVDNKLIPDIEKPAYIYCDKEIHILNLIETPIHFQFQCNIINIDTLNIKSEMVNMNVSQLKRYIIKKAKIKRDSDSIKISYKNREIGDENSVFETLELTNDMLNDEKTYIITFVVIIPDFEFRFYLKNSGKDEPEVRKLNSQKVSTLTQIFNCADFILYKHKKKKKLIDHTDSFLMLNPENDYDIELFDDYLFLERSKMEPIKLRLSRYEIFSEAISEKYKDIPYVVYDGQIDISNKQIEPVSNKKPYNLRIRYIFQKKKDHTLSDRDISEKDISKREISKNDDIYIDISDTNESVKSYAANLLSVKEDAIYRVQARLLNKDGIEKRVIDDKNTFEDLQYVKGDRIEILKLPPTFTFILDPNSKDNLIISPKTENNDNKVGNNNKIPDEIKLSFDEKTQVKYAKDGIINKYNISNEIKFYLNNEEFTDDEPMGKCPDSGIITIKINLPKYKFIYGDKPFYLYFKKTATVNNVLLDNQFKRNAPLLNTNHDMELNVGDIRLKENEEIIKYHGNDIMCQDVDPLYIFLYNNRPYKKRIKDGTKFKEIRNVIIEYFKELQEIQLSRIRFYSKKDDERFEINSAIDLKCNRENNEIIIKEDDSRYTFKYESSKKELKIRFKKEFTVEDAIKEIENRTNKKLSDDEDLKMDKSAKGLEGKKKQKADEHENNKFNKIKYDIKLYQNKSKLENDDNLFEKGLYKETIDIKKLPIQFHFNLNQSGVISSTRFRIKEQDDSDDDPFDSAKISLKTLIDKKLIKIDENKKDFKLLKAESNEKLPPIERFKVSFEGHIISADEPFFNIINGDKTKVIDIELLPPKFTFKLLSGIVEEQIEVERGTTVSRIRSYLRKKLGLGRYDFDLMSKPNTNETEESEPDKHKKDEDEEVVKPMDDESSFDDYEQGETVFIVIPKNPLYKFRIMSNGKLSKVKQFRIDPRSTVREIKAITLPSTKAKRLDIYGPIRIDEKEIPKGSKPLDDMNILEKTSSRHPDAVYIILIKELKHKLQIKLPEFDQDNKDVELEVESNDTVEDIKNDLSEKIKNKKLALYHLNKRLNDDEKYDDLIIVKGSQIQCMYEYDLIFADKQYESLKTTDIIDDKLTVFECKKKCFDLIENSHLKNKINNLKRIQLKIGDNIINEDNKTIWKLMKKAKNFQITVIINEDEDFKAICDKKGSLPSGLKCESTVSELRKKCPNNIIIKLSDSNSIVFDDQNLFEIQGHKTCIQDLKKEDKMKEIIIEIDKKVDVRKDKLRKIKLPIAYDTNVDDIKEIIADKCLNDYNQIKDICVVFNEIKPIEAEDPYLKDFPYINYGRNGRILCDTQNLYAIGAERLLIVNKNSISAPEGSPYILVTYYDKDGNLCEDQEISYSSEMSVGDIIANISTEMNTRGKEEDLETILLYMGKILDPSMLLKNILVDGHNKFYCRKVRKMLTEH